MGRRPCCVKEGLNKGAWSAEEDEILTNYIKMHGEGKWRDLPQRAGLQRCGKSCRLRWLNYLRPDIKRGNISTEEDELIIRLHKLLGNRWSLIAGRLPGRTDNEIKNYWNTNLSKRVHGHKTRKQAAPKELEAGKHKVIRTKAVKCTKAVNVNVITPLPRLSENNNLVPKYEDSNNNNNNNNNNTPSSSSAIIHEDINPSMDFLMDLDINELLIPEAPFISDFHDQILQVDIGNGYHNEEYGRHGLNLLHEIDELYSSVDEDLFKTNETSLDLRSLASYLDLED